MRAGENGGVALESNEFEGDGRGAVLDPIEPGNLVPSSLVTWLMGTGWRSVLMVSVVATTTACVAPEPTDGAEQTIHISGVGSDLEARVRALPNRDDRTGESLDVTGGQLTWHGRLFDLRGGTIDFDNPNRLDGHFDLFARTEIPRLGTAHDRSRIDLHLEGTADQMVANMTSDPPLDREDIALLVVFGLTRAELDSPANPSEAVPLSDQLRTCTAIEDWLRESQ